MPPLDEASLSRFHMRAVVASGVGFFTDAYDCSSSGSPRYQAQVQIAAGSHEGYRARRVARAAGQVPESGAA
jgi:hypothetical protein